MEQSCGALPALPSLGTSQAKSMAGPTPFSNWVISGQVIAGAYPASMDDVETERMLTLLLELGINTFVCLQAEVNIHIPDHSWRSGMGLRPYIRDAQKILSKAHQCGSTRIKQRKIDFLHLPIIDGSVTTDNAMSRLADDCCERVLRGEKLYIHCWGGHGRTGTLVATMLGRLYNLPYSSALRYTQGYHDTRVYPQGVRSPQTAVQRAQVRRLLVMPSEIPAMVASRGLANTSASSKISPMKTNITPSTSSRSAVQEPGTPTRAATSAAAAAQQAPNTLTPKQLGLPGMPMSVRRQLSYPSAVVAGRSPMSTSSAPDLGSNRQSSSRFHSGDSNQPASEGASRSIAASTCSPAAPGSRHIAVSGATTSRAGAYTGSSELQQQQQQQQRVVLGAAASESANDLLSSSGLFRSGQPVQQRLSRSLLQRSLERRT